MIVGTGLDIIEIERIKNSIDRFEGKFEERIFTEDEIAYCRARSNPFPHFAGRFAAKEAALKSLQSGLGAMRFTEMEIVRHEDGHPELVLHGAAAAFAASKGAVRFEISLTHTSTLAQAVVAALDS